jgi:hypothetical protein
MIHLRKSLDAWGTREFEENLKTEIAGLDASILPLQQGLSFSSHAVGDTLRVLIIGAAEQGDSILAKVGIFYEGVVAGCSCADDPTPDSAQTEYCVVQVDIDRKTAEATLLLLPE